MIAWIKARWAEISTKVGIVLATLSAMLPQIAAQLQTVNQQAADYCAMAGGIVGVLLILWREGQ